MAILFLCFEPEGFIDEERQIGAMIADHDASLLGWVMKLSKFLATAGLALAVALPATAEAAVVVNISQVGSNVSAVLNGSVNLTGLQAGALYTDVQQIRATPFFFGTDNSIVQAFTGFTGPASAGAGTSLTTASLFSGSTFALAGGFANLGAAIFLDPNYVSGSALASSLTYTGASFASLGLTEGQYIYTSRNDSITFNVGAAAQAVPEPATWAMMLVGFGGIGFAMRRQQRKTQATVRFA